MQEIVKDQQRQRREAAIQDNDDEAYARAFFDYNRRLTFITTVVHDTIFDYFGISTQQIEISGIQNEKNIEYKFQ